MPENTEERVSVADLRESLGALAKDRMVALQLQELEAVERIKDEVLPYHERRAEEIEDADHAVKYGLEIVANYVKYNQRWNDTLKTLMAIIKSKTKNATAEEDEAPPDPLAAQRAYLIDGVQNEANKPKAKAKQ